MFDMSAYYEASSVENAIQLRLEHPDADIIAGGSDVLIQMREGKRAGHKLISIYMLDELRGVSLDEDGTLRIGSLTSFSHITKDPLIRKYIPVLGEAVDMVGGPQIRNIGTIGGNTCNGVTSADSASIWIKVKPGFNVWQKHIRASMNSLSAAGSGQTIHTMIRQLLSMTVNGRTGIRKRSGSQARRALGLEKYLTWRTRFTEKISIDMNRR